MKFDKCCEKYSSGEGFGVLSVRAWNPPPLLGSERIPGGGPWELFHFGNFREEWNP